MNQIPEGKEQIYVEAVYKEPIEGIPFSNVGLTVGVSKYIDQGEIEKELDGQIQRLVKEYFDKLASEVKSTRNEMMDKLRVELDKEYADKLKEAKRIILEQREQIKLLNKK